MIAGCLSLIVMWLSVLRLSHDPVSWSAFSIVTSVDILSCCAFMHTLSVFLLKSTSQAVSLKVGQTVFILMLF